MGRTRNICRAADNCVTCSWSDCKSCATNSEILTSHVKPIIGINIPAERHLRGTRLGDRIGHCDCPIQVRPSIYNESTCTGRGHSHTCVSGITIKENEVLRTGIRRDRQVVITDVDKPVRCKRHPYVRCRTQAHPCATCFVICDALISINEICQRCTRHDIRRIDHQQICTGSRYETIHPQCAGSTGHIDNDVVARTVTHGHIAI